MARRSSVLKENRLTVGDQLFNLLTENWNIIHCPSGQANRREQIIQMNSLATTAILWS